ncbi:splicing factor 3A subunit 1-like protein [Jimgerdemannia flammicorona]|uniref:Splicing factor 3A subunit 1-like protein n=1 Tax=Jimgerdemannia flammicorona TaxID=994334 RepID=A0A433Q5Y1_9FUNG|nr:splicing factor 3A subunit 1-like protein [Jimgerdemannia flammicorona]
MVALAQPQSHELPSGKLENPDVEMKTAGPPDSGVGDGDGDDEKPLIGIIYPPPDVRSCVDKRFGAFCLFVEAECFCTRSRFLMSSRRYRLYPARPKSTIHSHTASFVARNGIQFEERIRENEKHNPKFCFLNPNDPYHAYYQYKITEAKEGRVPKKAVPKETKVEEVKMEVRKIPKEPPAFEFTTDMPAISAQDLDILKLTAQFVARNGRQFMNALAQREARNYQFDFLRPSHSLFNYFTKLVEQYTKVLIPPKHLNEQLRGNVEDKYQVLERIRDRVEWVAWQEAEKKKREDKEEQERSMYFCLLAIHDLTIRAGLPAKDNQHRTQPRLLHPSVAYASIDWHDFVIVETVEFTEADETMDLPPPMSLVELESMTLTQKKMASILVNQQQTTQEEEKTDEMDIEEVDMDEDDEPEEQQPIEIRPPDTSAPMKIRKDYVSKVGPKRAGGEEPTQLCPRCGQPIPVSEMAEHMRIELLDPKWKEQKMAADAKKKDSNLLQEGTDVAKILKNFSGYRSDIFGTEEVEIGRKIGEIDEENKKKADREKVVWDGHTASINLATQRAAQGVSIDEQIAAIHRSKGLTGDDGSTIGPRVPSRQPEYQQNPYQQQHMQQQGVSGYPQQQPSYPSYGGAPPPASNIMPPGSVPMARPPPPPASTQYPGYAPPPGANVAPGAPALFSHQLSGMYPQPTPPRPAPGVPAPLPSPPGTRTGVLPPPPALSIASMTPGAARPPAPPVARVMSPTTPTGPPGALLLSPIAAVVPPPGVEKVSRPLPDDEMDDAPGPKKAKNEGGLIPEEEWKKLIMSTISIQIQTPPMADKPEWGCDGQLVTIAELDLRTFVSTLKDRIQTQIGMPAARQKLTLPDSNTVMKNTASLAYYNLREGSVVVLGLKERGKK